MLWEQIKSRQEESFVILKSPERLKQRRGKKVALHFIKQNCASTPFLMLSKSKTSQLKSQF